MTTSVAYLPPGFDEAKMKEEYDKFLELQKDPKFMDFMKEQEEAYKKMITDMYGLKIGEKAGDQNAEGEEKKPKKKRKKRVKRLKQEGDKVVEEDVEIEMEVPETDLVEENGQEKTEEVEQVEEIKN